MAHGRSHDAEVRVPVLYTPGIRTLENVAARALKFLAGSNRNLEIKGLLLAAGFDHAARTAGWTHLHLLVTTDNAGQPVIIYDPAVVGAIKHLDQFDTHYLPIVHVTLLYNDPQSHDVVFEGGLAAADGPESVLVSRKLLDRVDTLPQAAQDLLAKRGLTAAVRQQARGWLATVEGVDVAGVAVEPGPEELADEGAEEAAEEAGPVDRAWHTAAVTLWRWLDEWTTIARRVLTRREHLIQLGLAQRKAPASTGTPPPPA